MSFHKMVSMVRTHEEKEEIAEERNKPFEATASTIPDVPYGLRICLTHEELDKLGLEADCEVGDMVHLVAMAEVTSVSTEKTDEGNNCRIELSITHLAVEDEDDEEPGDD